MSLTSFKDTFDNVAKLIASRHPEREDYLSVLKDFEKRIESPVTDPRLNRELTVEPKHDAQLIGVSISAVEDVCAELQQLNILHIWVRAVCPSTDDHDTIVETDRTSEFNAAISSICPHCSQRHMDLGWDSIECFYAFNITGDRPRRFRMTTFIRAPKQLPDANRPESRIDRIRSWISDFFLLRARPAVEQVRDALSSNQPLTKVPEPQRLLQAAGRQLIGTGVLSAVVVYLVSLCSVFWACISGLIFFLVFSVLALIAWRALWVSVPIEARILKWGMTVVAGLLLSGGSGVGIRLYAANDESKSTSSITITDQQLIGISGFGWNAELTCGEADQQLLNTALVVFVSTLVAVVILTYSHKVRSRS